MDPKELAGAQRELDTAGPPEDKERVRFRLVERLGDDLETLRTDMAGVENDFRDYLSRWTSERVADDVAPHVRDEDRDDFKVMLWSALAAVAGEAALAAWTFNVQRVNPWYGVASAVIITALLHGALSFVLTDKERPKIIIDKLQRYFFRPSLIAFGLAAAIGLPVRYVRGVLALIGKDIFPIALSIATLALLTLAAALLTAHAKLRWAVRFENHWHRLRKLISENEAFLHLLERSQQRVATDPKDVLLPVQKQDPQRSDLTVVPPDRR